MFYFILFLFPFSCASDDFDNVSKNLFVSHYDCTKMQDNRMYSLNKVAECKITPENLYVTPATITLYQKNYRTDLAATMCSVKAHVFRYNCGMFSHSSYVHTQNSITYDLIVTPEMCRQASKTNKIKISSFSENFDAPIEFDTKKQSNFNDGQSVRTTIHCSSGQVQHYTFETFMQRVNLTFDYGTKEVSNPNKQKLPCLLMEGGCETTTLDPFAYTWDTPENCVMTKILTQEAKMLKYPLSTNRNENQFFLISEYNETGKGMNLKIKVFPESYELCGKPERLFKTNFESLFVTYQGGFAMPGGELRTKEHAFNAYQFSIDNSSQVSYSSLSFSKSNGQWIGAQPWHTVGADEIDYELHLGTKLDYIMYFKAKQLRHSEMTLLQSQCELERTQMLTILMLAMQNTRLAGYMLTGNRSMFLDTDGSVAWLYHCPKFLSPLKVLDKCYDRIPIMFERSTKFVYPITRQTYDFASEIPCLGDYTNVFQLDLENDNSWYQLLPEPMPFNKPLLFKPTELGHITQFPTFDTRRAGMYTPNQMKNFWDNVIHNSASDTLLKKLTRTILTRGNSVRISEPGNLERLLSLNDRLLLDHLLTPSFFVDKFKETFGELGYIIQCLGNFFACFLLVKFVIDVVVIVLRGLEIRKNSGATFGFVRTMLGATFNLFVLSLQTPMYENEENKRISNGFSQNPAGNRPIAAPMYEENPTLLYPQVHLLNNPIAIGSTLNERQRADSNVLNQTGNAPSTLNTFLQNNNGNNSSGNAPTTVNENAPSTSNNNSNGNAPLPPP